MSTVSGTVTFSKKITTTLSGTLGFSGISPGTVFLDYYLDCFGKTPRTMFGTSLLFFEGMKNIAS